MGAIKIIKNSLLAAAILLLLYYAIGFFVYGAWYENFETQYEFGVTGYSGLYYFGDFDFLMNKYIYKLYIALYKWNDAVSWRAYIYTGIILFCAFLFLKSLLEINVKCSRKILLVLITLYFLSNSLVFLNFTRVAMIAVATGWLVVLGFISFKHFYIRQAVGILLIVVGSFTRIESSLIASALVFAMVVFKGKSFIIASIRHSFLPAIFILGFYFYASYTIATSNFYYHLIEPDVEYAINISQEKRIVPLGSMKNKADSLRYISAISWHVEDSMQVNPTFLRSIITYENKALRSYNIIAVEFLLYIKQNGVYNMVLMLAIGMACVYICFSYANCLGWRFILLFIWFATLYILPLLLIRIEARVQEPMIFCMWMCLVLLLKDYFLNIKQLYNAGGLIAIYFTLLYTCVMGFYSLKQRSQEQYVTWIKSKNAIAQLEKNYKGYYVYPYDNALELFFRPAFHAGHFSSHKLSLTGFAQMSYTPNGKKVIENFYGCEFYDYACRFQFIKNNKQKSILIGSKDLEFFFTNYLKHFYGLDFRLQKVEKLENQLYIYKVL